jgi:hypothetical protein
MSLMTRALWISLCGLVWSAACSNEPPATAQADRGAAGAVASPVVGGAVAGSSSAPSATTPKPGTGSTSAPASTGSTSQPNQSGAAPAPISGAAGAATPAKPAASGGSAGSAGSLSPAPAPATGSATPPVAGGGAAGAEALPDLTEILPPLSTPETRVPSPDNPAECPATAPENPVGDCLGLPVYLECTYGTYYCVCDWFHWLCAG